MTVKNDFKPFATGKDANVTPQEEWEHLPELSDGFKSGEASSAQVNKAIRQASFVAAALAQYIVEKTNLDVRDDGDIQGFITKLIKGLEKDFAGAGSGYLKEEADKRFLPATTRIPDAWTKTEASKRFQPKGDYQPAGYAYSKKESDKRYLPVSTKIPDAYSKKESDKKYQLKGEGVGYSKEDIDNKFSELGTAAQKDVNRDPKKPDKGAVLCVGDLGIGDPIFIPAKGRLADFLASAQGLFYVTAGDAFFFSDKPEWFDDHEVIYVFVQGSGHTYGPEAKYIRLWNHLGQEAFCIFKSVSGGGTHHPEFSGWKRVFNGDNYYTKEEMEETFLKMPNHANHTSAGSVGMFLYRGEVALSAGSSVSGATLDPACIVFKQTINPHVYSGGDPRGMPGTWRALGMIDRNSVCLFARVA